MNGGCKGSRLKSCGILIVKIPTVSIFIYLFSRKTCKILQLKPIHYTYSYSDILTTKKKQTKMYNNFNYLKL